MQSYTKNISYLQPILSQFLSKKGFAGATYEALSNVTLQRAYGETSVIIKE